MCCLTTATAADLYQKEKSTHINARQWTAEFELFAKYVVLWHFKFKTFFSLKMTVSSFMKIDQFSLLDNVVDVSNTNKIT